MFLRLIFMSALLAIVTLAQKPNPARYISYDEARSLLQLMDEILPPELRGKNPEQQAAIWSAWVSRQDAAVRSRLLRGDEDTLANFLLFGTSFTRQPRITTEQLDSIRLSANPEIAGKIIISRIDDLIRALASPAKNPRRSFLKNFVLNQGYNTNSPAEREKLRNYLIANLIRVLREQESYSQALAAARALGNASEEFAQRSKLYKDRGLSLDTSLSPNFAIEQSLQAIKSKGLVKEGGLRRIAIVGPGLDFTDKSAGFDFYPEQTLQPFAVADSAIKLGLSAPGNLKITTFDISPRINQHLKRMIKGEPAVYTIQLPIDSTVDWKPELLSYWQRVGDRIGSSTKPAPVPNSLSNLKMRAFRVRREIVRLIDPVDLNIVFQRIDLPESEKFDLIIATNILVYYDTFEQSLALANIREMLKPSGILLSNNALLELPVLNIRSAGYQTVVYSNRPDDGDHIVWYMKR